MKKATVNRVLNVVVFVFVLGAAGYAALSSGKSSNSGTVSATETSTTVPGATTIDETNEGGSTDSTSITDQVRGFLEAYYLLTPDDTEQSRRERVQQYMPGGLAPGVNVGMNDGSAAEQSRREAKITVQGRVLADRLSMGPAAVPTAGSTEEVIVMVPVYVTVTTPEGQVINEGEEQTVSRWAKRSGNWVLVELAEGGDME